MKEGKPYIRIQTRLTERHISVVQKQGKKLKTLRSFGNAKYYINWTEAIAFLLLLLHDWYLNRAARESSEYEPV